MPNVLVNGKEVDVNQFRNDWALALMSQGFIVKLAISRWRATAPLKAEDLGLRFFNLDSAKFMNRYVNLGQERLLPPEVTREIEQIELNARNNLKNFSFNTVWGNFVPYTAFSEWETINNATRLDFMEAARRLGERYEDIISIVKNEYKNMAKDVWSRLYPNQGDPTESFVEDFVSKVVQKIPDRNNIVASFKYDITYFVIPMPSLIEENMAKAQKVRQEKELREIEYSLEKETKKKVAEEYVKRKQELIDSFLEATVSSMRKYVAELCEGVLISLSKNDSKNDITKTQKDKIKKMIKRVNMLNFHNDDEIKSTLLDLESEVDKFKGERDKTAIVSKLQKIVDFGTEEFLPKDYNPAIGDLEV